MAVDLRVVAVSGILAVAVAGTLATPAFFPQAFANEPQHQLVRRAKDIFPPPFDPSRLKKFDITIADTVSTEPKRTQFVSKIEFGRKSLVEIVTTPTGTYSTDALTSPNVRYPGIDVRNLLGRAPATGQRIINEQWSTDDVLVRHKTPEAAVFAVGRIISHRKIRIAGHFHDFAKIQ